MKKLSRRALFGYAGTFIGGWAIGQYASRLFTSKSPDLENVNSLVPKGGPGVLNDASGLSETPIFKHEIIETNVVKELSQSIRTEILAAQTTGRPFNIGAARHSMGGQAIPRGGHAVTLNNLHIEVDSENSVYRVHGGARWHQVIAKLDPLGFSPKVMQSNHDFGALSTFCVNAHGWPVRHGPMGTTVRSFKMILPNGENVFCSPAENTDLFFMTMGGYGLTGAIYSMEIEMTPNLRLEPKFEVVPTDEFAQRFVSAVDDNTVHMAYGRFNVGKSRFFEEGLLGTYRKTQDQSHIPEVEQLKFTSIARYILRSQLDNERGKRNRWWLETNVYPKFSTGLTSRNNLVNVPVAILNDGDPNRTDILHEYFVSPEKLVDFIKICQDLIPSSYQELLNITLRFVDSDSESWLNYSPEPRIASVLLFSQEMTERAEADMKRLTRSLVEQVLDIGGSYYLPYRLHPTAEQFLRAYPRAGEFAETKRKIDPKLTFRNNFWDTCLSKL